MTQETIPNCWNVVLDPLISDSDFKFHLELVRKAQKSGEAHHLTDSTSNPDPTVTKPTHDPSNPASDLPTGAEPAVPNPDSSIFRHVFHSLGLRGYSGKFDDKIIHTIRALPIVQNVSPVYIASLQAVESVAHNGCWGLGAISHPAGSSPDYRFQQTPPVGAPVFVYVVDNGVMGTHNEFRDLMNPNGVPFPSRVVHQEIRLGPVVGDIEAGHGTHVAGIIAGNTCGVARFARIVSVKVFDATVDTGTDDIIAALQWIVRDIYVTGRAAVNRCIVNMSFSTPRDNVLNSYICKAFTVGILFIAAAGDLNEPGDRSPASSHAAISVGSTMVAGPGLPFMYRYPGSNFGPNVDIFAPGHNIRSSWSDGLYRNMSGTSLAASFVAGVAAYYLAYYPHLNTPGRLVSHILCNARVGIIGFPGPFTPNLFLSNRSEL